MRDLLRQLRTSFRSLARQPGSTLWIVATLALGIGAATGMFTYLAAWVWPPVEAPDPERVVNVFVGSREDPRGLPSIPDFRDLERGQKAVVDLVSYASFGCSLSRRGATTHAWGQSVSGGYFRFFGVKPAAGRLLDEGDDGPGAERVLVLTYPFWKRAFAGDLSIVGESVLLNGRPYRVVGLTPKRFQGQGRTGGLYLAHAYSDEATGLARLNDRDKGFLGVLGRLAPGTRIEAARSGLQSWARSLDAAAPLQAGARKTAVILSSRHDDEAGEDFFLEEAKILTAAALLFLLLACASVANLLLARATARRHDASLRAALGAGRGQIAFGLLLESLLLALAGGGMGLGLALVFARRLESYANTSPIGLGNWSEGTEVLKLDGRMIGCALAAALLAALLCGLGPVLQALRPNLLETLKSESGGSAGGRALASRRLLVIAQVALSVVLLLGAGLLARTLRGVEDVRLGFDLDRLVLASIFVPRNSATASDPAELLRKVLAAARADSQLEAVGAVFQPPLSGFRRSVRAAPSERRERPEEVDFNLVSDGFFDAIQIPIIEGRPLGTYDRAGAPPVVVVDQALARKLFGTEHAVGRTLYVPDPPRPGTTGSLFQIVGVAASARYTSVVEAPAPLVYFSIYQQGHPRISLVVRTYASPPAVGRRLVLALKGAHPDLSLIEVMSGREAQRAHLFLHRMQAEVATLFGSLGVLVAALGIFGLLSYTVTLRARELAIRGAVGAQPRDLVRLVVRQGMTLAALGLAAGALGGLALTRYLQKILFGVSPTDPVTFLAVTAGLGAVAFLATYLPAHRAAQGDPLDVLRVR